MKKMITLSLVLASTLFAATAASAQNKSPQMSDDFNEKVISDIRYDDRGNRRDEPKGGWNDRDNDRNDRWDDRDNRNDRNDRMNRVVRVVTKTRFVRQGFKTFRETVRFTYYKNGKVVTKVINRVRVR